MSCRANNGVHNQVYEHWKGQKINSQETLSMDGAIVKVPLARRDALKTASSSVRKSCGGENARIPMLVGKKESHAMKFAGSPGQTHDALDGL